jgi:hypothetical protein
MSEIPASLTFNGDPLLFATGNLEKKLGLQAFPSQEINKE